MAFKPVVRIKREPRETITARRRTYFHSNGLQTRRQSTQRQRPSVRHRTLRWHEGGAMKCLLAVVACLFVGCQALKDGLRDCFPPSEAAQMNADYGERVSQVQAEKLVVTSLENILFDPYSAFYKFSRIRTGWRNLPNCDRIFGYYIEVDVNAKNRYGGYTGYQRRSAIIRDGVLISIEACKDCTLSVDALPRSLLQILDQVDTEGGERRL